MAEIAATALTFKEWASRRDPKGGVAQIIDLLSGMYPMQDDIMAVECNMVGSHKTTIVTGYPTPTWRLLNYGVQPSKGQTAQVVDSCGMLEDYLQVDKSLADLAKDRAAFLLSESRMKLASFQKTLETKLFYGNQETDPEEITGLTPRYNDSSAATDASVRDHGGTNAGVQTSIWAVTWGDYATHAIFPDGSPGGWSQKDLGEETLTDAAGGLYQGYRVHYKWDVGLCVKDWRYNARLANIQASAYADAAARATLLASMVWLVEENLEDVTPGTRLYCNRTVYAALQVAAMEKGNVNLTIEQFAGRRVLMFRGIPVRKSDGITHTEAVYA